MTSRIHLERCRTNGLVAFRALKTFRVPLSIESDCRTCWNRLPATLALIRHLLQEARIANGCTIPIMVFLAGDLGLTQGADKMLRMVVLLHCDQGVL